MKCKSHVAAQMGISLDEQPCPLLDRANIQKTKYFLSKLYNSSSQLEKIPNTLYVTDLEIWAATGKSREKQWEQSEAVNLFVKTDWLI